MVFSTILFLCAFLPVTIIGYYIMPAKLKNYFLLLMSLFFYAWGEPKFVWVMLGSVLCNYGLGIWLERCGTGEAHICLKKAVVSLAVLLNIGILFVFKYLTFAMESVQRIVSDFPVWTIALPIGISFYTFQGLSYVIDVYRGERAQRNPFKLALYISMFPQLIAGPIVRYKDVRERLDGRVHSPQMFAAGAERFVVGLAKKAVLANMTGQLANNIMTSDVSAMGVSVAWLGALAYTLQIYFDFSGYSDMAIGLGKIFGFDFLENFDYPYISRSVREFWRRWHMSLSGWFRDYLYIPLGGNRRGNVYFNLAVVFLATGIWHGADWGFLLWGVWHGCFILIERFLSQRHSEKSGASQKKTILSSVLGWIYTMFVVVVGWVLFGIVDIRQFGAYASVMFGFGAGEFAAYGIRYYLTNQMIFYMVIGIFACVPWGRILRKLPPVKRISEGAVSEAVSIAGDIVKKALILCLLVICFVFIINSSYNPFIYFRF